MSSIYTHNALDQEQLQQRQEGGTPILPQKIPKTCTKFDMDTAASCKGKEGHYVLTHP